ncbi:MAG: TIGR01459 family HAD-type hydrolase [Hyphomicrobiaceae bacterium]|nr:TIGR01459 family HAD-type hydrolase [Hyphomicrobiaceae bacterium]
MSARDSIPVVPSIEPVADRYEAWLCDIWGVLHNGVQPFNNAEHACCTYRKKGGTVVLISNSPRPGHAVRKQLAEIGVSEDAFDAIVTSGDTTRHVLAERKSEPVFHLGPQRDKPLLDGLDLQLVDLEDASLVLCSGLYDDLRETPDDYADMLSKMLERGLEMVCANPDIQVERGNRLIYCAGALAEAYGKRGGKVIYTGKPHPPIYEMAMGRVAEARGEVLMPERILCIGDSVKTDVAGASAAGMDVLFVASALHIEASHDETPLSEEALQNVFADSAVMPIAAQKRLTW